MNVVYALVTVALFGAVAGMVHGLIVYDGFLLPRRLPTKSIKQGDDNVVSFSLFMPGALGHALVGAVGGVIVFCVTHATVVFGYSVYQTPTLGDIAAALAIGLGGSTGLNLWLDTKDLLGVVQKPKPVTGQDGNQDGHAEPGKDGTEGLLPVERMAIMPGSTEQQAAMSLLGMGVAATVIPTPSRGVLTNHAFDLYQSLP